MDLAVGRAAYKVKNISYICEELDGIRLLKVSLDNFAGRAVSWQVEPQPHYAVHPLRGPGDPHAGV